MSLNRKRFRIGVGALLLIGVSSGAYLLVANSGELPENSVEQLQTSVASRGDLVLYASGSGTLVAGREAQLGFGVAGTVAELLVQPGDRVSAGELLAVQDDVDQLEADVAAAELALLEAQQERDTLIAEADLATAEALLALADATEEYEDAQADWQAQQEGYRASSTTIKAAEAELKLSEAARDRAKDTYDGCGSSDDPQCAQLYKNYAVAVQRYWSALANLNWYTGHPTETQQIQLDAELALAEARRNQAQRAYDRVADGPDEYELAAAKLRVESAAAELEVAQANLEQAQVTAPFDGVVMEVSAEVGESVSSAFIMLADFGTARLEVFLDETDASMIEVGHQTEVVFDAMPDQTLHGTVIQVDPGLNNQGGFSTISGLVELEQGITEGMLVGMNAAVDVIGGRAEDAVLVPYEALRDLGQGDYAVFVMEDGQPRLRTVEVGLTDFTFAEIVSGLEAGEVVTTGVVETG